jgi:hypothetical protein
MKARLTAAIKLAKEEGRIYLIDWDTHPMPSLAASPQRGREEEEEEWGGGREGWGRGSKWSQESPRGRKRKGRRSPSPGHEGGPCRPAPACAWAAAAWRRQPSVRLGWCIHIHTHTPRPPPRPAAAAADQSHRQVRAPSAIEPGRFRRRRRRRRPGPQWQEGAHPGPAAAAAARDGGAAQQAGCARRALWGRRPAQPAEPPALRRRRRRGGGGGLQQHHRQGWAAGLAGWLAGLGWLACC